MSPSSSPKFKNPRARYNFQGRTCSISGVGSYVPAKVLTNADLARMVETTDEWITTRTGIKERRIAAKNELTSQVIVVGDVSGKGAPAALYGAMVSGTLRSLAPQKLLPPDMLKKLNLLLLERKIEGHFITLTYAIWEPRTKGLHLANAGMPLPILP